MKKQKRIKVNFTIPSNILYKFEKIVQEESINKSFLIENLIEEWIDNLYQFNLMTCSNTIDTGNIHFIKGNRYIYKNMVFTHPYTDIRVDIKDDNGNYIPFYIIGTNSNPNSHHIVTNQFNLNDYFII